MYIRIKIKNAQSHQFLYTLQFKKKKCLAPFNYCYMIWSRCLYNRSFMMANIDFFNDMNIDNLLKVVLQFLYLILICKITFILALENIPFPHFFQSIIMATVISSTHILVYWCFLPKCIHKRNLKTSLLDISIIINTSVLKLRSFFHEKYYLFWNAPLPVQILIRNPKYKVIKTQIITLKNLRGFPSKFQTVIMRRCKHVSL